MNELKITKAKVYPYKRKSRTGAIGVGMIFLDNGLLLTGLELIERDNKRFINYPKNPYNKKGRSYVQPVTATANELITNTLFDAYYAINPNQPLDEKFLSEATEDFINTWTADVAKREQKLKEMKEKAEQEKTEAEIKKAAAEVKKAIELTHKFNTPEKNAETSELINECLKLEQNKDKE